MAVGEITEVANAMEAVGQGVEQETPDELIGRQAHDFCGALMAIVFPGEGDMIVVAGSDAAVGDGDAMRVAPEIGEDFLRGAEGETPSAYSPLCRDLGRLRLCRLRHRRLRAADRRLASQQDGARRLRPRRP